MGSLELPTPLFFLFLFCCFVFCKWPRNSLFYLVLYVYRRFNLPTFLFFFIFLCFAYKRDKEIRTHHSFLFPFLECCCYLCSSGELEFSYSLLSFFLLLFFSKWGQEGGTPQIFYYYYFLKGIEK